jgi:hypothetical protein
MDKYSIRRAGVTALGAGLAAAGAYAASKGLDLPMNHQNDEALRGVVTGMYGAVGAGAVQMGMEKLRKRHSALNSNQFGK